MAHILPQKTITISVTKIKDIPTNWSYLLLTRGGIFGNVFFFCIPWSLESPSTVFFFLGSGIETEYGSPPVRLTSYLMSSGEVGLLLLDLDGPLLNVAAFFVVVETAKWFMLLLFSRMISSTSSYFVWKYNKSTLTIYWI